MVTTRVNKLIYGVHKLCSYIGATGSSSSSGRHADEEHARRKDILINHTSDCFLSLHCTFFWSTFTTWDMIVIELFHLSVKCNSSRITFCNYWSLIILLRPTIWNNVMFYCFQYPLILIINKKTISSEDIIWVLKIIANIWIFKWQFLGKSWQFLWRCSVKIIIKVKKPKTICLNN